MCTLDNKTHSWPTRKSLTCKHYKDFWSNYKSPKEEAKNPFSDPRKITGNQVCKQPMKSASIKSAPSLVYVESESMILTCHLKSESITLMHLNWTSSHLLVPLCLHQDVLRKYQLVFFVGGSMVMGKNSLPKKTILYKSKVDIFAEQPRVCILAKDQEIMISI